VRVRLTFTSPPPPALSQGLSQGSLPDDHGPGAKDAKAKPSKGLSLAGFGFPRSKDAKDTSAGGAAAAAAVLKVALPYELVQVTPSPSNTLSRNRPRRGVHFVHFFLSGAFHLFVVALQCSAFFTKW
jgi:hypothetical protein